LPWVQITLAIIVFRILIWFVIVALRRIWTAHSRAPRHSLPLPAEDER
jgi:hypothetical protein